MKILILFNLLLLSTFDFTYSSENPNFLVAKTALLTTTQGQSRFSLLDNKDYENLKHTPLCEGDEIVILRWPIICPKEGKTDSWIHFYITEANIQAKTHPEDSRYSICTIVWDKESTNHIRIMQLYSKWFGKIEVDQKTEDYLKEFKLTKK